MSRTLGVLSILVSACAPVTPHLDVEGADLPVGSEGEVRSIGEPGLWCYAFTGVEFAGYLTRIEIDLATGDVAVADRHAIEDVGSFHTPGVAWNGAFFTMIGYDGSGPRLLTYGAEHGARYHDGTVEHVGIAFVGGDYYLPDVWAPSALEVYPDVGAIVSGAASGAAPFSYSSRVAWADGELYGAWHSTGTVEVTDLDGNTIRTVHLEGYDDWVWGLAVVDGHLAVHNGYAIYVFDAESGAAEQVIPIPSEVAGGPGWSTGLACSSRRI